jgi:HD-like signal output (HDOD) protein
MPAAPAPFITQPPRSIEAWTSLFDPAALPVLGESADALEALRANEDDVDAHLLAETFCSDPLMTLKLLAHVSRLRRSRDTESRGDTETLTAALVMLGIGPFFRTFTAQPAVEDLLAAEPEALAGFNAVLKRSHRAANFAAAFAVHRMDHDVAVIHEAALLHDFTELLLWVRAPALASAIAQRQHADPSLRSAKVQRELLNIELADLQHALMQAWGLPALLVRISDDRHADSDQVRNVLLALRVARHSAHGWDNPALPDDVRDVADLLKLGHEPAERLLRDIDA